MGALVNICYLQIVHLKKQWNTGTISKSTFYTFQLVVAIIFVANVSSVGYSGYGGLTLALAIGDLQ